MNNQYIVLNKNEIDDVANFDRSVVEERNEKLSITILKTIIQNYIKITKTVIKDGFSPRAPLKKMSSMKRQRSGR